MGFKPAGLNRLNRKEFGAVLEVPLDPGAVERNITQVTSQIPNLLNIPPYMTKIFYLEFRFQLNSTCTWKPNRKILTLRN